jgi:hypothetical protein
VGAGADEAEGDQEGDVEQQLGLLARVDYRLLVGVADVVEDARQLSVAV